MKKWQIFIIAFIVIWIIAWIVGVAAFVIRGPQEEIILSEVQETEPIFLEDPPLDLKQMKSSPTPSATETQSEQEDVMSFQGVVDGILYDSEDDWFIFWVDNWDYPEMYIQASTSNIPTKALTYLDYVDLYVDITLTDNGHILNDWYLIDKLTCENVGKLTNEEIITKYEISEKHPIMQMGAQPNEIYLSTLQENVIYSYTPDWENMQDYPEIINDTGEDCLVYTKHTNMDIHYGMYAAPITMLPMETSIFACSMYEEGDEYHVMYTKTSQDNLLNLLGDDACRLSRIEEEDYLNAYYMYVYNDTNVTQKLTLTSEWDEEAEPIVQHIAAGQLIGCTISSYNIDVEPVIN